VYVRVRRRHGNSAFRYPTAGTIVSGGPCHQPPPPRRRRRAPVVRRSRVFVVAVPRVVSINRPPSSLSDRRSRALYDDGLLYGNRDGNGANTA